MRGGWRGESGPVHGALSTPGTRGMHLGVVENLSFLSHRVCNRVRDHVVSGCIRLDDVHSRNKNEIRCGSKLKSTIGVSSNVDPKGVTMRCGAEQAGVARCSTPQSLWSRNPASCWYSRLIFARAKESEKVHEVVDPSMGNRSSSRFLLTQLAGRVYSCTL